MPSLFPSFACSFSVCIFLLSAAFFHSHRFSLGHCVRGFLVHIDDCYYLPSRVCAIGFVTNFSEKLLSERARLERSARAPSPPSDAGVWPYDTLPCAHAHFFPNALPPEAMFVPAPSEATPMPAPLEAMPAPTHLIATTPPKTNKMLPPTLTPAALERRHSGD